MIVRYASKIVLADGITLCYPNGMENELDSQVRDALLARKGDWPRIARKAEVSHSWISQFVREKIPNPGIETLRRLKTVLDAIPEWW